MRATATKKELYARFGLQPDCGNDVLTAVYKVLARKHHPDAGGSHEQFIAVQTAYEDIVAGRFKAETYADPATKTPTMCWFPPANVGEAFGRTYDRSRPYVAGPQGIRAGQNVRVAKRNGEVKAMRIVEVLGLSGSSQIMTAIYI